MKKIFKKVLSSFVIISLISNFLVFQNTATADANPWTLEKAEHLARRVLIGVDQNTVNSLYNAGSATAAVNLLFPDANGPDRTAYNNSINSLTSGTGFDLLNSNYAAKLYQLKYFADPYEAKRKLFMVFEDIFSSNPSKGITYKDINDTQDLIYSETLGNYKNLIKKILYNNGQGGDFTEGQFLDLFNQANKKSPNENYARELLQLFLMEEYKPLDNKDLGSTRNYEETDVASFAKMIFGFTYDTGSTVHTVNYQTPTYTGSDIRSVAFLTGALKSGDNFSFYNSASGTIDLAALQDGGGASLRDNAINYIFSKREDAISQALANKLFRFYVNENPTSQELNSLSSIITQNNFDILPSIKWLLSSDMMYSDTAMNELRYKNPIELGIGTLKELNQNDKTYIDPVIYNTDLLTTLGWTPYAQNSIFGREGFDKNDNFFNANLQNKWISYISKLAYSSNTRNTSVYNLLPSTSQILTNYTDFASINPSLINGNLLGTGVVVYNFSGATNKTYTFSVSKFDASSNSLQTNGGNLILNPTSFSSNSNFINFSSGSFSTGGISYPLVSLNLSPRNSGLIERSISSDETIADLERTILLGHSLDTTSRNYLVNFLNTDEKGNSVLFDATTSKEKIESLSSIMMTMPEFILNSGFSTAPINLSENSFLNGTNSKLIFVDLPGGYDYLNNFFSKKNYDAMKIARPSLYRKENEIVDLGDFYMENHIAYGSGGTNGLKELYDEGTLRIFNRIGSKNQSRDHDQASKALQSCDSYTESDVDGTFGKFIKNEIPSNTMVIGNSKPFALRGGKYINIGSSGNIFSNYKLSRDKKNQVLDTIRNIGNSRTFPGNTSGSFKDAITLDSIGTTAKAVTPRDGAGYGNTQNYDFIKAMMDSNYGKAFYLFGNGGYDTHGNEAKTLDNDINSVVTPMVDFFDKVKNTQDVTIVLFSEFGRTIKENGSYYTLDSGTDHGEGGVMWVLTSNGKLKAMLPQKIYGDLDISKEKENWLGVGIYYDSIYSKIIEALYGKTGIYEHKLENDISTEAPKINNFNTEEKSFYGYTDHLFTNISFDIDSPNFEISAGSSAEIKYGTGFDSLTHVYNSPYEVYLKPGAMIKGNRFSYTINAYPGNLAYQITIRNNQYIPTVFTGVINTGPYVTGSLNLSSSNDTYLSTYKNGKTISGNETLVTPILIGNVLSSTGTTGTGETSTGNINTGILLPEYKILTKGNGNNLIIYSGTTNINRVSGSGIWNGRFILGDNIDTNLLFGSGTIADTGNISFSNAKKVIKYGADSLGISLKLNQNVDIETSGLDSSKKYNIFYSEDLKNWKYMTQVNSDVNGKVKITTNHFTYFAFVDTARVVVPPVVAPGTPTTPLTPVSPVTPTPAVSSEGGGGGGSISRDYCPTGDLSPSYYDNTCLLKTMTGSATTISTGIMNIPVLNIVNNTGYEKKYIKYKGLQILDIKNYSLSQSFRKQAFSVALSKSISAKNKVEYIKRLNALLEAKFALDTDKTKDSLSLKNRYIKQKILLDSFYKRKIKS